MGPSPCYSRSLRVSAYGRILTRKLWNVECGPEQSARKGDVSSMCPQRGSETTDKNLSLRVKPRQQQHWRPETRKAAHHLTTQELQASSRLCASGHRAKFIADLPFSSIRTYLLDGMRNCCLASVLRRVMSHITGFLTRSQVHSIQICLIMAGRPAGPASVMLSDHGAGKPSKFF